MKRYVLALGIWLFVLSRLSHAALPVIDAANLTQTTWTSAQSTVIAAQAVALVIDSALNLEGLNSTELSGINQEMQTLASIIQEGEGLMWDIRTLEVQMQWLFSLETAPDNTQALRERLWQIRRYQVNQQMHARRIQTIQNAAISAVNRIMRIADRILGVVGNRQGSQQIQAQLTNLQHLSNRQGVIIAAYQQAQLAEMQTAPLVEESTFLINEQLLTDWPGR